MVGIFHDVEKWNEHPLKDRSSQTGVFRNKIKSIPRAAKELPITRRTYRESVNVFQLRIHVLGFLEDERLVTVKVAVTQHAILINPDMRTPQPKPTRPKR